MELLLAVAVGLALGIVMGLLGGGGGVLAVPLLLLVGLSLGEATTTSLVVVVIGAVAGLVVHARSGSVDWTLGLVFGLLGGPGAVLGSRVTSAVDDRVLLGGFVVLLVVAGLGMLRGRAREEAPSRAWSRGRRWVTTVAMATGVGMVTGVFGVGGGFIAVPALVLTLRLPMRRAGATGLVVIVLNAAVALAVRGPSDLEAEITAVVALSAAAGAVVGSFAQPRVAGVLLQRAFGVLLLLVAAAQLVGLVAGVVAG